MVMVSLLSLHCEDHEEHDDHEDFEDDYVDVNGDGQSLVSTCDEEFKEV